MKSDFALDLDLDRVRLLARTETGLEPLGTVGLSDPLFKSRLAELRRATGQDGPLPVDVMIPPSLVLFLDVAPGADENNVLRAIGEAASLAAEDLAWAREGDRVAVVARQTIDEARAFAEANDFAPVSFMTASEGSGFSAPPVFEEDAGPQIPFHSRRARERPDPQAEEAASGGAREPASARAIATPPGPSAGPPGPASSPARSEAEALTVFGARERERGQRASFWPLVLGGGAIAAALAGWLMFAPANAPQVDLATSTASEPAVEVEAPGTASGPDIADGGSPVWLGPEPDPNDALELPRPDAPVGEQAPRDLAAPLDVADAAPDEVLPPPPPGTLFDMDERGFVRATPSGARTPAGHAVHLGAPAATPPPRPGSVEPLQEEGANVADGNGPDAAPEDAGDVAVARADVQPSFPAARPMARPDRASEEDVALFVQRATEGTVRPPTRPDDLPVRVAARTDPDFDDLARRARSETAAAGASLAPRQQAAPVPERSATIEPTGPTRRAVARQATTDNAIDLSRTNLIGVYGSRADRRALVRLPTGRYVKLKVGDRFDGGRIAAIGNARLDYVRGGRKFTITIPNT